MCKGDVHFYIVIGEDLDGLINDLAYIAKCNTCERFSGMANSIYEAYNDSQTTIETYNAIQATPVD